MEGHLGGLPSWYPENGTFAELDEDLERGVDALVAGLESRSGGLVEERRWSEGLLYLRSLNDKSSEQRVGEAESGCDAPLSVGPRSVRDHAALDDEVDAPLGAEVSVPNVTRLEASEPGDDARHLGHLARRVAVVGQLELRAREERRDFGVFDSVRKGACCLARVRLVPGKPLPRPG